jgi:hypothetical protein
MYFLKIVFGLFSHKNTIGLLSSISVWNYGDTSDIEHWVEIFFPAIQTKRTFILFRIIKTVEMDCPFYEEFNLI